MAASSQKHDSMNEKYLDDDFAEWLQSRLLGAHQPGVAVAVIKDGHVESSGYGFAQLPDVPATADTLWIMASTTKAFTTTLLGKVLEDQTDSTEALEVKPITWKTPVSEVLPDFVTTDDYVTKYATIEDIASHRSGVAGHDLVWGPVMGPSLSTAARLMKYFEAIEGKFRSTWQYNNLMYAVLGNLVERISGKTFNEVFRKEILDPLDMKDTYLGIAKVAAQVQSGATSKSRVARGYYFVEEKDEEGKATGFYVPDQYSELTGVEPAGALVSSVNDYAKWVLALLKAAVTSSDDEKTEEESIISHELWKELTTPRMPINLTFDSQVTEVRPSSHATPSSYCLGWVIDAYMYPGEIMICHSGGLPGFSSLVTMLPDRDIGVVVVGNGGMTTQITDAVAKELFGRRLGLSKEERRCTVEESKQMKDSIPPEAPLQDVLPMSTKEAVTEVPSLKEGVKLDTSTARLEGDFVHPAYGTFHITTGPASSALTEKIPTINGARILRQKDSEEKDKKAASPKTDKPHPLLVVPLGKRGMETNYLFHPSPNQPYSDKIIFDLETLWQHGDLSKETIRGMELDVEVSNNENYPLRQAVVWQSIGVKEAAAVFEWVGGSSANSAPIDRVGLRLMRVDGPPRKKDKSDSGRAEPIFEPGWEKRMIWMSKLYT